LNEPDFGRRKQNWLAVYDNTPQPVWDLGTALAHLRDRVASARVDGTNFDRIFIERWNEMVIVMDANVVPVKLHRPASAP
jgi:hypothetical protein